MGKTATAMPTKHSRFKARHGVATLWTILTLPVMVLLACWAIESGRLYLARQQLVTALESAALAGVKEWCASDGVSDTLRSRQFAQQFGAANVIADMSLSVSLNYDSKEKPNNNLDCAGDLVYGTVVESASGRTFYTGLKAGCGNTDGPNAHATRRVSSESWQTVTMCGRNYTNMVVVGTPVYESSNRPAVVRIRNATSGNSFDFFVQDTNSGQPVTEIPVYFLIVEQGIYTAANNGVTMEAMKYNSTRTDYRGSWIGEARAYANAYIQPVVVGQVMTYNDPNWSVFWDRGISRQSPPDASLFTGKHVGQDPNTSRINETVGYIVIEQGIGTLNGLPYYAGLGPDSIVGILNGPRSYDLPGDIASYVVASKAAEDGGNGGWAVAYGPDPLSPAQVDFVIDEYLLADRRHTNEQVAHIVLGGPCVVRARSRMNVPWLTGNAFGWTLFPTSVSAEVLAMLDCDERCVKLICVDTEVCR